MPQVDAIYAASAAVAPRRASKSASTSGIASVAYMPTDLKRCLHHDRERWRRDGLCSKAEASQLVAAVQTAIKALES